MKRGQRGLALVSMLLVVALLTLLLAGMLRSHRLLVAGVGQQLDGAHLLQLALAGEQLMLVELASQVQASTVAVHSGQAWARPRRVNAGPGQLTIRVEDLAGRMNISTLIGRESPAGELLERWQRLCAALDIAAPAIEPMSGQPILDVSQLGESTGLSPSALNRLRPWLAALPPEATLNVNTAPARVLASLPGMSLEKARRVIRERPVEGFERVEDFMASPALQGLELSRRGLGVTSRWFRVEVMAEQDDQQLYLYSDLEIDIKAQQVHLVRRHLSAMREQHRDE